jgi:hypothetical protein
VASRGSGGGAIRGAARVGFPILLASIGAALLLPVLGLRAADRVLLDFGPNDAEYVRGFRADWEPDGATRFHWTSPAANVSLPLLVSGDGARLRIRMRRHFVDPAQVRLFVEGRTVSSFSIQADPKVAYRVIEVPLPHLEGRHPFVLSIEASAEDGRGLGVALDWLELECGGSTRLELPASVKGAFALAVAFAFLSPWLAGAGPGLAAAHAGLLVLAGAAGAATDPLAFERVVRLGTPTYLIVALVVVGLARWSPARRALRVEDGSWAGGALAVLVLIALVVRLAILLNPLYFYPDVRVHGLFALQLARRGFLEFLRDFTANQFRYSLGLQQVGDHWYAFPYPPVFYMLAAPLVRTLHYRPEVAVSLVGSVVNSLEALVVFALARHLGLASRAALAGSAVLPLLPLFLVRLSLAYFPALVGHAVDAVVVVYLVARYREIGQLRVALRLAALLALALLTYTQGVLNFAVFLGQFLLLDAFFDRTPAGRERQRTLVAVGLLAGALSLSFYGRYVPTLLDMRAGRPMPEERILLDKFEQRARVAVDGAAPEEDDPFAGPTLDLWRGVRKAGWRLWVFYGVFAPVVVLAVIRLAWRLSGPEARLVWAWALTFLTLNLASGGLPGPNLVRYNKDLEIVAPLFCAALGALAHEAWSSAKPSIRRLGIAASLAWVAFGAGRAWAALSERIVLER